MVDLLTVAFSRREEDAVRGERMGREMLQRFDRVYLLADAAPDVLTELTGLEGFELLRCRVLIEIGRRIGRADKGEQPKPIADPRGVYEHLEHLRREKKEFFWLFLLDAKNQIIRDHAVHIGTLSMSLVGPREIFREAIREGACSIIVAHNHPSGDPTPSPEDVEITLRLKEIGEMLDIPLLDHVIVGATSFRSLKEMGTLG
jgi:DNA repair protein RadC